MSRTLLRFFWTTFVETAVYFKRARANRAQMTQEIMRSKNAQCNSILEELTELKTPSTLMRFRLKTHTFRCV